ncbi:hypothetical protein D9758_019021 [Tetrapyrgos nigripes]|uniref:Uncharacterized protein n=1 Tax=Tetrapyrgos nigripes TaxID=182062 RepID=A0A8H5BBA5_9AGAR|nr:hypothetical protein D9758_019021 [Tetrapyrgos nigripes]
MGIAIRRYLVKGPNRYYVLAFYGAVFGGVLPGMVGRWWFGSRQETKDSINATSTAVFFKGLEDGEDVEDVAGVLSGEGGGEESTTGGRALEGGEEEESIEHFRTVEVAAEAGKRGRAYRASAWRDGDFNLRMGSADCGIVMLMEGCYLYLDSGMEMMVLSNGHRLLYTLPQFDVPYGHARGEGVDLGSG